MGTELKPCGNCTACCGPNAMPLEGMFEAFQRCQHAKKKGCGIYGTRPQGCRDFQCEWTRRSAWPSSLRPDRAGFIVRNTSRPPEHNYVEFIEMPQGIDPKSLQGALRWFVDVCLGHGKCETFKVVVAPFGTHSLLELDTDFATLVAARSSLEVAQDLVRSLRAQREALAALESPQEHR